MHRDSSRRPVTEVPPEDGIGREPENGEKTQQGDLIALIEEAMPRPI